MLYRDGLVPTATRVPRWGGMQVGRRARSIHVLMVEDDPAIAEMFQMQFEHDGYRVTVAGTAEVGLAAIAADPPDIVLLDLLLPDRSGFELMTTLEHQLPSHPPIVILSNFGEPDMISQGLSLGAVDYLVKARVTPSLVSRSIPGWLDRPREGPGNQARD